MIGLDTSVVVRLLVGVPEAHVEIARDLLNAATTSVIISDLVVGESYFVLRHHYGVPHPKAIAQLHSLLTDARIAAVGIATDVLARLVADDRQPGVMDRLIHADYDHQTAEMYTFDRDAARLPGARLLQ